MFKHGSKWMLVLAIALVLLSACAPLAQAGQPLQCKLKAEGGHVVNLYQSPDSSSPVLAVMTDGETVTVLQNQASWRKVETQEGAIGWVYAPQFCQ